jgi:hypothetical protein
MSSQTFADTTAPQRDLSIVPWDALREYQDQVVNCWHTALNWPFFFHASAGTEKTDSIWSQQKGATESVWPDIESEGAMMPHRPEEAVNQTQPNDQAKDAESGPTEARRETPDQPQGESRPHDGKPARKRVPRQPAEDKKGPERTGRAAPAVLDGLRHRSYSVKLAAVSAMTTNKKLRTQEAIPLLQRIVDNQTIRRRDPELRAAAKAVLEQSRKETGRRSTRTAQKRSPARAKSRRQRATA